MRPLPLDLQNCNSDLPATACLLLQRYLKNGGYPGGTGGPAIEVDLTEPTPELMGTVVRYMQWYAASRPGDPVKERSGGRKVGGHGGVTF